MNILGSMSDCDFHHSGLTYEKMFSHKTSLTSSPHGRHRHSLFLASPRHPQALPETKDYKPILEITWAGSGFTEVMEGGGVGEGEGVLCDLLEPDLCGEK